MKFHLENLNDENSLKSLKYIMLAGEPLTKTLVDRIKQIIPNGNYNGYGHLNNNIFNNRKCNKSKKNYNRKSLLIIHKYIS